MNVNHNNLPTGATADAAHTFGAPTDQQSTVNPTNTNTYDQDLDGAQTMSFSGRFRSQGSSYWYGGGVQPPSIGSVRPIVLSNPSGGGYQYPSGQPPSLNDVGKRERSQTGPSYAGGPIADSDVVGGMSLTAPNFKMYNPNAFQKDDGGN